MLHGNGEDGTYFKGQIDEFAKYFQVHVLDTRGHGKSPRGDAPFIIAQFAEDLKEYMDQNQMEKAHILGFSDGGNIALVFALKYPEHIDKLILNGANLDPQGVRPSTQIPIELGYRIAKRTNKQKTELLGLMVNDPNIDKSRLRQIKAETLVIAGTRDVIKRKHTKLIAQSIPNSTLKFIEGGHFIAAREPEKFNEAVLEFLNSK